MNKLLFIFILMYGCAFNPKLECLKIIEEKPYIPDIYMCTHKSKEACKCLKENGYNSKVVCGPIDGPASKAHKPDHCWIEIENNGEIYWYDPTWHVYDDRYGFWPTSKYTDRKIRKVWYSKDENGLIKIKERK